jgi:hypothetical protein
MEVKRTVEKTLKAGTVESFPSTACVVTKKGTENERENKVNVEQIRKASQRFVPGIYIASLKRC